MTIRSKYTAFLGVSLLLLCALMLWLSGCGTFEPQTTESSNTQVSAVASEDNEQSVSSATEESAHSNETSSVQDELSASTSASSDVPSEDSKSDLINRVEDAYGNAVDKIEDALEKRSSATPAHAAIGEELAATENLAVSVVSVEAGPYDYADKTPTVKVVVAMRNTSDKVVYVKASNWDADTTDGRRVDHKYYVKDEAGGRSTKSFLPTKVSPGATFQGELYFDGEGLVSVIYEPHWLISSQNEYLYFDVL